MSGILDETLKLVRGREAAQKPLERFITARQTCFKALDALFLGLDGGGRKAQLLFPWEERFSVGADQFDQDHQRLMEITNDLQRGMKEGRNRSELANFTGIHFGWEEG